MPSAGSPVPPRRGPIDSETLVQQIGRELINKRDRQKGSPLERGQTLLLAAPARDATVRTSLLRFIDVLGSLDFDTTGAMTARLAREYLGQAGRRLPAPFQALSALTVGVPIPPILLRRLSLQATNLIAGRFIVEAVAGDPSDGALRALHEMRQRRFYPSFDVLGEHVVSVQEAEVYLHRYLRLIDVLAQQRGAGEYTAGGIRALQVSVKLSALTADFIPTDPEGTLERLREPFARIVNAATTAGVALTVDVEEYRLRDLTWFVFEAMFGPQGPFARWPDAGIVLQAYLKDAPEQAAACVDLARRRSVPFQVRLVKGAYWDYESLVASAENWTPPVLQVKAATDRQFELLADTLAGAVPAVHLAIGSHNLRSHAYAEASGRRRRLPAQSIEHQTLYGMAPTTSRALRDMGWSVRQYIPIGGLLAGMSYLVRRILENSSQTGILVQSRRSAGAALLRPPPAASLEVAAPPSEAEPEFRNCAPFQLFRASERERFATVLRQAAAAGPPHFPLALPAVDERPILRPPNPSAPDDRRPVVEVEAALGDDVLLATQRLRAALPAWQHRSLQERAAVLRRAADDLLACREEFAAAVVLEGGKNWANALADVDEAVDYLRYYPFVAEQLGVAFTERYRARGVVAVIPPWNFPLAIPCGMTAAALITGNAVALKPAEQTPGITARLVVLLHRAGVPPDVLLHLPGDGQTVGAELVRSPEVDMVAFTGSREVGLWIAEAVTATAIAGGLKHALTEMGGKNAIAVFADADLDEAVEGILSSTFGHANQKCSACSRVFADEAIYPRLRRRLTAGASSLTVGPATAAGTFINPLIDAAAMQRVRAFADVARGEGKVVLDLVDAGQTAGPYCLGPLVVEIAPRDLARARTAQEEIFGPILMLAPFRDETEALAQINGTPYGLTAGVFSRSPATIRRMIRGIRAGNIYVNREITGARVGVEPFGGMDLSGTGPKAGGSDYLFAFVRSRAEFRDRPVEAGAGLSRPRPELVPWRQSLAHRRRILSTALEALERGRAGAVPPGLTRGLADVLGGAAELTDDEPTLPRAGQRTWLDWSLPRGIGVVLVDDLAPPLSLGRLTAASLLAGNGTLVASPAALERGAAAFLAGLRAGGVPANSLASLPGGSALSELPAGQFDFVAADVGLAQARRLAASLGRRHPGQRGIPAFLSVLDAPAPGEPGFLRRFSLPRTIAIRTLHHGADLGQ